MDDISNYRSVFREPTVTEINTDDGEYVMYGMNMPSSGGATLAYIMNILNNLDGNDEILSFLDSFGISDFDIYSSDVVHSLISMYNIAFADRNEYMGDSDFENVPIDDLLNPEYHKERGREYLSNVKIDTPIDFGIIGNYSSVPNRGKKRRKTALNLFGLDDKNTFGGKRPRSSMSPTIIFEKIMTDESKDSSSDPSSSSDDSSTVLEPILAV